MASFTIPANPKFPNGTDLGAYLPAQIHPPDAPTGTAVATATAGASGVATFTGLGDATAYIAAAIVTGVWQYVPFTTAPLGTVDIIPVEGPKGDKGDQGDQGDVGDTGPPGDTTAAVAAVATEATARQTADSGHVNALDPHGDRAYVNAKFASLVANNPGMVAPS